MGFAWIGALFSLLGSGSLGRLSRQVYGWVGGWWWLSLAWWRAVGIFVWKAVRHMLMKKERRDLMLDPISYLVGSLGNVIHYRKGGEV